MSRRKSSPPVVPAEPGPWEVEIEAIDDFMPFGRYRITLTRGFIRFGGNDGWGWTTYTYTLAGAHRRGARELSRITRREERLAVRQNRITNPKGTK